MVIFCDVDGVVADLHTPWLDLYNAEWGDSLTVKDITDWDILKFVKPECGEAGMTRYIKDPHIYDLVEPIDGALGGVNRLREDGHKIIFATSVLGSRCAGRKFDWLNDNGFDVAYRDYIEITSKHLLCGDALIDDGAHNLQNFRGLKVLYTQPWNRREWLFKGEFGILRLNSWYDKNLRSI